MDIQPFEKTQAPMVLSWLQSFQESNLWCGKKQFPLEDDVFDMWHLDPDIAPFVGVIEQTPVVYGEMVRQPNEAEIMRLLVAPEHRKQGIALAFVTALLSKARDLPIYARIAPHNAASLGCFKKAGFQPVSPAESEEFNALEAQPFEWLVYPAQIE